ncbi:MAG: hypothetical protein IT292_10770 [Deltaproteobacteria bacterium]|nr:hypothetical protein [Deltaproteobacteria bacterium]
MGRTEVLFVEEWGCRFNCFRTALKALELPGVTFDAVQLLPNGMYQINFRDRLLGAREISDIQNDLHRRFPDIVILSLRNYDRLKEVFRSLNFPEDRLILTTDTAMKIGVSWVDIQKTEIGKSPAVTETFLALLDEVTVGAAV